MRLSTRLILLILLCMLPILGAQFYTQINLHGERQRQAARLALRQAELANAAVDTVVAGMQQVAAAIAQFPELASAGTACDERLTSLQRGLPAYRFLAIATADDHVDCASTAILTRSGQDQRPWLAGLVGGLDPRMGPLTSLPGIDGAFLPVAMRLPFNAAVPPERYLIIGLDLRWLSRHLETTGVARDTLLHKGVLTLTDRDGNIVARYPNGPQWVGRRLSEPLYGLVNAPAPGTVNGTDQDGRVQLTAFMPTGVPPLGLAAFETLAVVDLSSDLERTSGWDLIVIGIAAAAALLLAWLAGRRFIYRPTESLLQAARRWRDGDLSARAVSTDAGSEFAALAQSFNAMAAGLQTRDLERRLQAQYLESQVAERTRELSETNNRLQVEIAEREKTEAALHQAQKLQAVGQLAGGIAHDFNNMLATVLGNLELMERRVAQSTESWTKADAERLARLIDRATGAVQRGAQLTSRLLAFSRRQRLTTRSTDLNKLVTELITLATSTLGRRVRVISNLSPELWPALVDPSQVEAAILNLCLNARDAMPEGGQLTISTANEILSAPQHEDDPPPGPYVRVSIADTGIGMSAEVRRRAFDPFFTTKGPGGSGLGLSQVWGMARQSGGTVRIESTPGQGTEVSLLLPRAPADAELEAQPAGQTGADCPRVPSQTVLVVDDDHAVRQVTVEMLRDLGCQVVQAPGGAEALALLDELPAPPDLVLLDYAMPGMNGPQLARRLRDRGIGAPDGPLVTGYAELADNEARATALDGLLRKPFTIRELQALLAQLRARERAGETEDTATRP